MVLYTTTNIFMYTVIKKYKEPRLRGKAHGTAANPVNKLPEQEPCLSIGYQGDQFLLAETIQIQVSLSHTYKRSTWPMSTIWQAPKGSQTIFSLKHCYGPLNKQ